jgi:hypothetical protein
MFVRASPAWARDRLQKTIKKKAFREKQDTTTGLRGEKKGRAPVTRCGDAAQRGQAIISPIALSLAQPRPCLCVARTFAVTLHAVVVTRRLRRCKPPHTIHAVVARRPCATVRLPRHFDVRLCAVGLRVGFCGGFRHKISQKYTVPWVCTGRRTARDT